MGLLTLADHVQDIAENSIKAGAKKVVIDIRETKEYFIFKVEDNGPGIKNVDKVFDPFYTTRSKKIRKVGLGLPFLKQAAEMTGGYVKLETKLGAGTKVLAKFCKKHIDCQPIGDLPSVFFSLLMNQEVEFKIIRCRDENCYEIDSKIIKEHFGKLDSPSKLKILKDLLFELEKSLKEA
ncbi:ATP-binding protein [Thermosipho atlanticus]|uniref:histidine kinase n=1 Tax=Thermosipho atlanticus DSM 15807 TaxID=1123380 RepID=A0A1M5TJZ9_9BACT|nr:ATP-binding protein [Thermosipho atlanticus]SHH51019.1 Histidine kinase-, DNA gyrase B-, and HSP90-like ATPase [Thermosipho atlanticus DSM 15807]